MSFHWLIGGNLFDCVSTIIDYCMRAKEWHEINKIGTTPHGQRGIWNLCWIVTCNVVEMTWLGKCSKWLLHMCDELA